MQQTKAKPHPDTAASARRGNGSFPRSKGARILSAGAVLIGAAVSAVLISRGSQIPWISDAPAYRQMGAPDAKVTLVEFSDFQCPACGAAVPVVRHLEELYGPRLRVVYKHHPWEFHRWATQAAIAAECAGRQGKFWPLHDLLFDNQASWANNGNESGVAMIRSYAQKAGVEPKTFDQCLQDPGVKISINTDLKEAKDHWVNSTPTFFINGHRYSGAFQLRTQGLIQIEKTLGGS